MTRAWQVVGSIDVLLKYLAHGDILRMKATCKRWRNAIRIYQTSMEQEFDISRIPEIINEIVQIGRRQSKKGLWTYKQAHIFGYDICLVALGIRVSCLVDCMHMPSSYTETLLVSLTKIYPIFHHVSAIYIDDNVFFVHRLHFIQRKLIDLGFRFNNLLFIDVTISHLQSTPQLSNVPHRLIEFFQELIHLVHLSPSCIIHTTRLFEMYPISYTAVAGVLLNYPVVYTLSTVPSTSSNALAMQPLHVIELRSEINGNQLTLLQFSIPQALATSTTLKLLRSRCQLSIPVPTIVQTTESILPSVAL